MLSCFFFNDTATTEIYTLSLHDALPILSVPFSGCPYGCSRPYTIAGNAMFATATGSSRCCTRDRKSTRLNSSHSQISYAVFCLKKKKFTELDLPHNLDFPLRPTPLTPTN